MTITDDPATIEEYLAYVKHYADSIYVREEVDGKWDAVALSTLAPERWAYWVTRWLSEGGTPVRVRSDAEVEAVKAAALEVKEE